MENSNINRDDEGFVVGMAPVAGDMQVHCRFGDVEDLRSIEVLGTIGPVGGKTKFSGETNMATWREVPGELWAQGLGLHQCPMNHMAWRATVGAQEVVISALALMRALFRPTKYVLEKMFRPQGIDGVCTMVDGKPIPTRNWTKAFMSHESRTFIGPMTWMHCFPSARRLAASLYDYAEEGSLGCDLAVGRLTAGFGGEYREGVLYASSMFLTKISTDEAPFEFAEGLKGEFSTYEWGAVRAEAARLPLRDGTHKLSDAEWAQLQPLFVQRTRTVPVRRLIDGILAKVCVGATADDDEVALRAKLSYQHRAWVRVGQWQQIEAVVSASRTGEGSAEVAAQAEGEVREQRNIRANGRQAAMLEECGLKLYHYGPLNDLEWAELRKHVHAKDGPNRRSSRDVWDAMLKGFGDGVRWKRVVGDHSIGQTAAVRYGQLRRQGKWPMLAELLNALRPMKSEG